MQTSNPTTLTFCHFLQPLVCKTRKNDKIAINQKFISRFLLPLVCKSRKNDKIAINQNFISRFLLPLGGKTNEFAKNAINQNFATRFSLPLVCKTRKNNKIAINEKFEAAATPAGNLVKLSLTKKYNAISVTNNLRRKFFVMYIVNMYIAKKLVCDIYSEAVAIPAENLAGLCPAKKYKTSGVMNNQRSWFFIMYIGIGEKLMGRSVKFALGFVMLSWSGVGYAETHNQLKQPIVIEKTNDRVINNNLLRANINGKLLLKANVGYVYGFALGHPYNNFQIPTQHGVGYGAALGYDHDDGWGLTLEYQGMLTNWSGIYQYGTEPAPAQFQQLLHIISFAPSYKFYLDQNQHWSLRFKLGYGLVSGQLHINPKQAGTKNAIQQKPAVINFGSALKINQAAKYTVKTFTTDQPTTVLYDDYVVDGELYPVECKGFYDSLGGNAIGHFKSQCIFDYNGEEGTTLDDDGHMIPDATILNFFKDNEIILDHSEFKIAYNIWSEILKWDNEKAKKFFEKIDRITTTHFQTNIEAGVGTGMAKPTVAMGQYLYDNLSDTIKEVLLGSKGPSGNWVSLGIGATYTPPTPAPIDWNIWFLYVDNLLKEEDPMKLVMEISSLKNYLKNLNGNSLQPLQSPRSIAYEDYIDWELSDAEKQLLESAGIKFLSAADLVPIQSLNLTNYKTGSVLSPEISFEYDNGFLHVDLVVRYQHMVSSIDYDLGIDAEDNLSYGVGALNLYTGLGIGINF